MSDPNSLYAFGLSNFNTMDLSNYFKKYGIVEHINIPTGKDGAPCNYGYIRFRSPSQVRAAYNGGVIQYGKARKHQIGDKFVLVNYTAKLETEAPAEVHYEKVCNLYPISRMDMM